MLYIQTQNRKTFQIVKGVEYFFIVSKAVKFTMLYIKQQGRLLFRFSNAD